MKTFVNTKFWHAAFAQAVATIALFTGYLTGGEWIAATTLCLGIYVTGNIAADREATNRLKVETRSE